MFDLFLFELLIIISALSLMLLQIRVRETYALLQLCSRPSSTTHSQNQTYAYHDFRVQGDANLLLEEWKRRLHLELPAAYAT